MDAKVDYLSFTLPLDLRRAGRSHHQTVDDTPESIHEKEEMTDQHAQELIADKLSHMGLDTLLDMLASSRYIDMGSRKRYGRFIHWRKNNVSILWGGASNNVLVELSGVSCQMLRDADALNTTLGNVANRVTRLDVAVDFVTDVTPRDFIAAKDENRFKVTEQHDTDTGMTQYAGSRQSDRYARVYVYAPPHPRAGVLRVEHVLRKDHAKSVAPLIVRHGISEPVALLGNTFGWRHAIWQPDSTTDGKLRAERHDKDDAGTLRWLLKAVAPALANAHTSGLIDVLDFVQQHVIPRIERIERGE